MAQSVSSGRERLTDLAQQGGSAAGAVSAVFLMSSVCEAAIVDLGVDEVVDDNQKFFLDVNGDNKVDFIFEQFIEKASVTGLKSKFDLGGLAIQKGGQLRLFENGDTIDQKVIFDFKSTELLYSGNSGVLPSVGDSGYLGLALKPTKVEPPPVSIAELEIGTLQKSKFPVNFGYIRVERGSLILSEAFFEDTPNTPITIPRGPQNVPGPGALALLAAGAAGLAAMRRRGAGRQGVA